MSVAIVLFILGGLLILAGLAGILLPMLPGVPMLFAGMLVVAWGDDFAHLGVPTVAILAALMVLSVAVDLLANLLGAKRAGASRLALAGAALGMLVGLFLGLPGIVLGPFVGAFIGELVSTRHGGRATRVGVGTWVGLLLGTVAKLGIAFLMLGIFLLAWWF